MLRSCLAILLAVIASSGSAFAGQMRSGSFVFSDWSGPPLRVFFVEPGPDAMDEAPVVIVLHGVNRNADDYARNWRALASEYGLRVYVPEFSGRAFPGAAHYNLGGIGTEGPHAFAAIEPLFTAIAARGGEASGYYLFGHSAGAQFVHRALLFEDLPRLNTAFAANAGWYTLPDASVAWPYGLQGVPVDDDAVRRWAGQPLVVLLGERDNDPRHRHLRRTPEADAQGPHRYARGAFFAETARDRAAALGAAFRWTVYAVPGVAHDNAGMASAAAWLIRSEATEPPSQPD